MQQHSRGFALHPERKCDWNKDLDDIVKCVKKLKIGKLFALFKDIKSIPGHGGRAHCFCSISVAPPHVRRLVIMPRPHVTLQALQGDQCEHSPSSAIQYGALCFDNFYCYLYFLNREE